MKEQFGAAEIEFVLLLSGLRLSRRFHGPRRKWETLECVEPAMLPVWPGAEGSEGCRLVDGCRPDIALRDGGAERGMNRAALPNYR